MRKVFLFFLLFLSLTINSYSQFKLNGKIINYKGSHQLGINIPIVYGFYQENTVNIPVKEDGSFQIVLPITNQRFANIIFERRFHLLLLEPAKNLDIILNQADSSLIVKSGTALAENKIIQAVDMNDFPFFLTEQGREKYSALSLQGLKDEIVAPYFSQRDAKVKIVNASRLPVDMKHLLNAEIKYMALNYLNDLARGEMANAKAIDSLVIDLFDQVSSSPDFFPAGPEYYRFADNYIRYLEAKAFIQIKTEKIPKTAPIPYFNISLDSANRVVSKYGKPYWRWIGMNINFPVNVIENYTYQQLILLYNRKDLQPFYGLLEAFSLKFSKSVFLADLEQRQLNLSRIRIENENNSEIVVIKDQNNIRSVSDLIKPFLGKVVYLDIWGTWCGPCKEELQYLPELKAKFKGKDIVYLYLDLDEDEKDSAWRDFIKANAITGFHLRKNRQTIAPFWTELLADAVDKEESYPHYFIFDKSGKLKVTKAFRPSRKDDLYLQIQNVLDNQ
jgi:thiol-disulfide isomerase/thioredoxin